MSLKEHVRIVAEEQTHPRPEEDAALVEDLVNVLSQDVLEDGHEIVSSREDVGDGCECH